MARERVDNRREFLQLAQVFDPKKHNIGGWFMSEKLDGQRAFWDGGITRGLYCYEVPWANTAKDGIRVNPPRSTGLWSRYGKAIQAPAWWLDELPKVPLDGELYIGPGRFQDVMSTCRKLTPVPEEWEQVYYHAFGMPDYTEVFADGEIRVPNFEKKITGVLDWLRKKDVRWEPKQRRFEAVQFLLARDFADHPRVVPVPQVQLPMVTPKAIPAVEAKLDEVVSRGGEGLVLQHYNNTWTPLRVPKLLKVKPYEDCEVKVRGFVWGKQTDLGSKLLGLMGAMIVDFNGKRLELSGFTDAEREMEAIGPDTDVVRKLMAREEGEKNPGKEADVTKFTNPTFPPGSTVTIRYRELSRDGIPKEARYFRKRDE